MAVVFFVLSLTPLHATWYRENIEDGADIIMMDLRWPFWPSGSYFANWNSSFNPKPNNLSFYAGFTSYLADGKDQTPHPDASMQDAFRPGSVWTFWGSDTIGTPVRFVDVAPNLFIKNDYGGEGSSGTTGAHVWPFVQRNAWYTMVSRVWQPAPESNALIGRWIKDQRAGEWHLIGIAQLPIPATSFTGNSGFLEPLTSEKAVRSLHRRFGYYRKQGSWLIRFQKETTSTPPSNTLSGLTTCPSNFPGSLSMGTNLIPLQRSNPLGPNLIFQHSRTCERLLQGDP